MLQVYELHRLYHIQKILMKNIEVSGSNGQSSQERLNSNDTSMNHKGEKLRKKLDLEQPAEEYNAEESDDDGVLEIIDDESRLELTLGPVNYRSQSQRMKKAETPLTSDSGPSFSSSSTGSSHMKRTNKRVDTTKEQSTGHDWGLLLNVPDNINPPGFQTGRSKNGFHHRVDEQLRQERLDHHQTPWIFQVLSLNMT